MTMPRPFYEHQYKNTHWSDWLALGVSFLVIFLFILEITGLADPIGVWE